MRDFRDLIVWQKSVDLIALIYDVTSGFPSDERFGLTAQLRRAAVSVATNIAEGNGRQSTRDYLHFLTTSRGSLNEARSLLIISERLGFVSGSANTVLFDRIDEVSRILWAIRSKLQAKLRKASTP